MLCLLDCVSVCKKRKEVRVKGMSGARERSGEREEGEMLAPLAERVVAELM